MELGTQPVGKLLMQYAIPAIIAMTASSLYNIVDSIFIGQGVGPLAISGLAVTFPFMNLGAAFGAMVGVGASTLISVKLGQRDYSTAQVVLGNVVTLNTIIGVVYTIVCLMFLDPILYFFGASADTIVYARDFMEVILLGNIFTHMYLGLNAVLRASGHPQKAMYATINTVIINTILAFRKTLCHIKSADLPHFYIEKDQFGTYFVETRESFFRIGENSEFISSFPFTET